MKFAKVVFWAAGGWGILILTPLYFMFEKIGRQDPPPITHPQFFYGFVSVAIEGRVSPLPAITAALDALPGILLAIAFVKTASRALAHPIAAR